MSIGTDDFLESIEGWLPVEAAQHLRSLAAEVPSQEAIVELGAFCGRSTCWMADGSRGGHGAHITSVDPHDRGTAETFAANITAGGWWDLVTALRTTSGEAAALWMQPIGLLFIDAAHDHDSVWADFMWWQGFIPIGGVIAFDDYAVEFPGVMRVVDETVIPSGQWQANPVVAGRLWTATRIGA